MDEIEVIHHDGVLDHQVLVGIETLDKALSLPALKSIKVIVKDGLERGLSQYLAIVVEEELF
jgi:hypothetical protein